MPYITIGKYFQLFIKRSNLNCTESLIGPSTNCDKVCISKWLTCSKVTATRKTHLSLEAF